MGLEGLRVSLVAMRLRGGGRISPMLTSAVLQNHRIEDLAAKDASPTIEILTLPVELFVHHITATTMTPHNDLQETRMMFDSSFNKLF